MTVRGLIEKLLELDPKLPVYRQSRGGTVDDVDSVEALQDDGYLPERVEIL